MRTTMKRRAYRSRIQPKPTASADAPRSEGPARTTTKIYEGNFMNEVRSRKRKRESARQTVIDTVFNGAKEAAAQYLDNKSIPDVVSDIQNVSKKLTRNQIGSTGLAVLAKATGSASEIESTTAIGTMSNSTMAYVCNKHRSGSDTGNFIRGTQDATRSGVLTSSVDLQNVYTMDLLSSVPVSGDTSITGQSAYTRSSCLRAWQRHLDAEMFTPAAAGTVYRMPNQQVSLHWKTVTSELKIRNNNDAPVVVKIYDLVSKFSCGNSVHQDQYLAKGYMDPQWAWRTGVDDSTVIELGGDTNVNFLGSKPTLSTTFNRVWKITGETKINLTGSASHIHRSVYALNKTQSYQEFDANTIFSGATAASGEVQPWKEHSWQPTRMIIVYGLPSGTNQATAASVSWSEYFRADYICRIGTGKSIDTMV